MHSFAAHFYFVYLHPFCDGNGRCARILNASQLYHGGYQKMKTLPLASAMILQGLILFFVLGGEFFHNYRIRLDFGGEC